VVVARAAIAACEARGGDVEAVLRAAGLSREALASIEYRLPHESAARLWEAAAVSVGDPAFGLHVAETLPMGAYDVLDYMVAAAATTGEAIARIARYFRLVHDGSDVRLIAEPRQARLVRRGPALALQYEEFSLALFLVRSRSATGVAWRPDAVAFEHARPGDARELARVFGCPVAFGAAAGELRFDRSILHLPHRRADSRLLDILTRYADGLLRTMPNGGDLVAAVSASIARQLATRMPSLASTAAAVHLPVRTLQRRLAATGTAFSALVDEVRREIALKYIGDARLSIGEIGYLVHFSEPANFSRAFKRWMGEAPAEYRARLFPGTP
jgi:AraC-like DNA-binding protein